jgi:hypothetical protein
MPLDIMISRESFLAQLASIHVDSSLTDYTMMIVRSAVLSYVPFPSNVLKSRKISFKCPGSIPGWVDLLFFVFLLFFFLLKQQQPIHVP